VALKRQCSRSRPPPGRYYRLAIDRGGLVGEIMVPAAAMRKIATTTMPEITVKDPAIQTLTVPRNAIAPMVAMQGGNEHFYGEDGI
jgi:hypothetical protein